MKVIAVTIQKGGVGKTTSVMEISATLAKLGNRVLMIDKDPQQNLSRIAGADFEAVSIYDVLMGEVSIEDAIQHVGDLDVIIADKQLKWADRDFAGEDDIYRLAAVLLSVKDQYDFVVIDTPPSLGVLPSMALCAADYALVPCEASSSGVQGLGQLSENIQTIRDQHNPKLKTLGIFLVKYHWRTIFNRLMKDQIAEAAAKMNTKVFKTYIREAVAVEEAQGFGQSLLEYAPSSKPAQDYLSLAKEILKEMN